MKETPNYFAVIPADVRYDKRLSASEKLMYGEITSLCQKEGFCWASNKYFAELYAKSEKSIRSWIKNLKDCNYIDVSSEDVSENASQRKIYIKNLAQLDGEAGRKRPGSPGRKLPANNTSINTRPEGRAEGGLTTAQPISFTEPEAQATAQMLDKEIDLKKLLNAYSPAHDEGLMNSAPKKNFKKKFFNYSKAEREAIINLFVTYRNLLYKKNDWITSIFKNYSSLHEFETYFNDLKKRYGYVEPKKLSDFIEVEDLEYTSRNKHITQKWKSQ